MTYLESFLYISQPEPDHAQEEGRVKDQQKWCDRIVHGRIAGVDKLYISEIVQILCHH